MGIIATRKAAARIAIGQSWARADEPRLSRLFGRERDRRKNYGSGPAKADDATLRLHCMAGLTMMDARLGRRLKYCCTADDVPLMLEAGAV